MDGWGQECFPGSAAGECPTPDPSMPISETVYRKALEVGRVLFWRAFLFVHCQAVEAQLLLANRIPGTVLCSPISARDVNY